MSTPQNFDRLRAAIDDRAADLGHSLTGLATTAGIRYETLRALRNGENEPSPKTIRGLERALKWQTGSIKAILAGGDPTPLPEFQDPYESRIARLENISDEVKLAIIQRMRANREAAVAEAEAYDKLAQVEDGNSA